MNSYWIWSYGDYEIYHTNLVNSRRQEFGADYPFFCRLKYIEQCEEFFCEADAEKDGYVMLYANGIGCILIDNKRYKAGERIAVSKGRHDISIRVSNLKGLPAAYLESDVVATDGNWYTIDEKCNKVKVGFNEYYNTPEKTPEEFFFEYERKSYVSKEEISDGVLFDFGKEMFGYVLIDNVEKEDKLHVAYGETKEEALDTTGDTILFEDVTGSESYKLRQRAFRYIYITGNKNVNAEADYEYLPLEYRGSFKCNDETINKVWEACSYTLHLNAREVLLDGIKRDRWCWGGDVYQASKFCNYVFFDKEVIRRSILGLRGRGMPVEFTNKITDYSMYWIIGLWEYYFTFADLDFIKFIFDRAESMMEFLATREDENGLLVKKYNDWIFIDWSEIDKTDPVCAEQMLYIAANRAMVQICDLLGKDGTSYADKAEKLVKVVTDMYWDDEKGAFIDSFTSGLQNVTRHANIFAILYDIATDVQKESIVKNVLFNDNITKITTPYFEGYELDAMGKIGELGYIDNMLNSYWKSMIELGATSIWEEYDPTMTGTEHYAMYSTKYAKSLCHAWGAGPIYLLGKYYLGVQPTSAGYETFEVKPTLGSFEYIEGSVPVGEGDAKVYLSKDKLEVTATKDGGTLVWDNKCYELEKNKTLTIKF